MSIIIQIFTDLKSASSVNPFFFSFSFPNFIERRFDHDDLGLCTVACNNLVVFPF